jgi:hypothetical protein
MLAVFCLRLALGLMAALLLLAPAQINPRFYRTHFLVMLGLTVGAALFVRDTAGPALWAALAGGLVLAFAGSVVWSLEGAPAGRTLIVLSILTLAAALVLNEKYEGPGSTDGSAGSSYFVLCASSFASAALLGIATTAMLLGHSYLIAPGMSIQPLMRLLAALAVAVLLRAVLAGAALASWTSVYSLTNLNNEAVLWLPVRWGLGIVGPLVLAYLTWQTARIRSTQSATGILYVVVIFCFLGELTSQLLLNTTGYAL